MRAIAVLMLMGIATVQTMRLETALDQTDRAIAVAKEWEDVAQNALKQIEEWQKIGIKMMDINQEQIDNYRVCRSMLTPQQRGE